MATISKLQSGSWRVQVRRKGHYVNETFLRREDARVWATETERTIDRGETPKASKVARITTFRQLVDLHITDINEVGKPIGRSKAATLEMLKRELGALKLCELTREWWIKFGRKRASQGAGPVTVGVRSRSQLYHRIKRQLPSAPALLVAPLEAPKIQGHGARRTSLHAENLAAPIQLKLAPLF